VTPRFKFALPTPEVQVELQIPAIRVLSVRLLPSSPNANLTSASSRLLIHEFSMRIDSASTTLEPALGAPAQLPGEAGALRFELHIDRCVTRLRAARRPLLSSYDSTVPPGIDAILQGPHSLPIGRGSSMQIPQVYGRMCDLHMR